MQAIYISYVTVASEQLRQYNPSKRNLSWNRLVGIQKCLYAEIKFPKSMKPIFKTQLKTTYRRSLTSDFPSHSCRISAFYKKIKRTAWLLQSPFFKLNKLENWYILHWISQLPLHYYDYIPHKNISKQNLCPM